MSHSDVQRVCGGALAQAQSSVQFLDIDPNAETYPRPKAPALPVVSLGTGIGGRRSAYGSRFLATDCLGVRSGRSAIALALEGLGVGAGDTVLIPAYHCGSMVEPALARGAEPVFVKVGPDLNVDLEDLDRQAEGHGARVLIVPHYFGFPQALDRLLPLCRARGIAVIEDCAHAMFGDFGGYAPGARGDYAIASTVKFFPGTDGGILCCNGASVRWPRLEKLNGRDQGRAWWGVLETAAGYGRLRLLKPLFGVVDSFRQRLRGRGGAAAAEAGQGGYRWYVPADVRRSASAASRWLLRLTAKGRLTRLRRDNYEYLLGRLSALSRGRPLFPVLPAGVVPYMFPLVLEDPTADFPALKRRGVPILRWDEIAQSSCAVSLRYRHALIQVPCHQELRRSELEWIADTLVGVLGSGDGRE